MRLQQGDFGIQPLGGFNFRLPRLLCLSGRCKLLPGLIERGFGLGSRLIGGDAAGLQRLQLRRGLLCRFVQARAFGMQWTRRFQRADAGKMRTPVGGGQVRLISLCKRRLRLRDGGFHAGQGLMPAQRGFQRGLLLFALLGGCAP